MAPAGFPGIFDKRSVEFHAVTVLQSRRAGYDPTPYSAIERGGTLGNQSARQRDLQCVADGRFDRQLEGLETLGFRLGVNNFDGNHDEPDRRQALPAAVNRLCAPGERIHERVAGFLEETPEHHVDEHALELEVEVQGDL